MYPYNNILCLLEVTGQQILDALEWGARSVPDENSGFIQVSGLSYEIHSGIPNPCIEDERGMFVRAEGERRVSNVKVADEPLDPDRTYNVAGMDYLVPDSGDGFAMFDGAKVLADGIKIDNQVLMDYIVDTLSGEIGSGYENPCGQGRITIFE